MKVIYKYPEKNKKGEILIYGLSEEEFVAYKEEIEMTKSVFERFDECKEKKNNFKNKVKELNE